MSKSADSTDENPSATTLELDGRSWTLEVEWGLLNGRVEPVRVSVSAVVHSTDGHGTPLAVTADRIRRLSIGGAMAELRRAGAARDYAEWLLRRESETASSLQGEMDDEYYLSQSVPQALWNAVSGAEYKLQQAEELNKAAMGPQRGRTRTRQDHAAVALVYRAAQADGKSVTDEVANAFNISKSTASKRIMAARRAGLLEKVGRIE